MAAGLNAKRDEQLLAEHLEGVPGAFEELASRYADELFGFLLRFVGDPAAADDLVQEALLQVHLSGASFDLSRSFKPWVYTIAANKARDYLRSRTRRSEFSLNANGDDDDNPGPIAGLSADQPGVGEQFDLDETSGAVRKLVDQMPGHLREILVLGYYQQLPYADIAQILDIPVGTVKSRLHAAVNYFAKLWHQRAASKG